MSILQRCFLMRHNSSELRRFKGKKDSRGKTLCQLRPDSLVTTSLETCLGRSWRGQNNPLFENFQLCTGFCIKGFTLDFEIEAPVQVFHSRLLEMDNFPLLGLLLSLYCREGATNTKMREFVEPWGNTLWTQQNKTYTPTKNSRSILEQLHTTFLAVRIATWPL